MSQSSADQQHRAGKRRARRLAVTAALSTATAAVVGLAAPASATTSTNERLLVVYTFPSQNDIGKAVATGLVNGAGTVQGGRRPLHRDRLPAPGQPLLLGDEHVSHQEVNPRTCIDRLSGTDSLQVTGGTGIFTGATGTGSDSERAVLLAGRNPDGSCNLDAPPVGGADLIDVKFNLTLRH